MTRIITVCCILLAVAAYAVMSADPSVKVSSSVPRLVNPGDEFMVRISIDKSSLRKGAVLQQFLPEGLTATAIENESAQFYFENQMVRFVWENMPEKTNLLIAYKVRVNEHAEGIKKISGTLIYSKGNSTAQLVLPEDIIYISNEIPVSNAEHIPGNSGNLSMKRTITEKKGDESNSYRITIEVINNSETGFASWVDQIPSGYSVEVNQANNGEFRMDGSLVKFNWRELPAENSWSFAYTLLPLTNTLPDQIPEFLGMMIYGTQELAKTCVPSDKSLPASEVTANTKASQKVLSNTIQASAPAAITSIPTIQRGIYYRVQIAATKRSPVRDSQFFNSRFKISSPVDMIEQDGWRKYCIGTFGRLAPAKTFAMETRSNIPDAFVVAYRDGQRIPVDEAMQSLSISQ